jgi:hypothetical protein
MDFDYVLEFRRVNEQGQEGLSLYTTRVPVRALIDGAEYIEVEIKGFIRKDGWRLEHNFYGMLKLLDDIGVDPSEYYIEGTR